MSVCNLFDSNAYHSGWRDGIQIIQVADQINVSWPYREILSFWLKERTGVTRSDHFDAHNIGEFVGSVGSGIESIYRVLLGYAERPEWQDRIIALVALEKGWHNSSETAMILRRFAVSDEMAKVRITAVHILIEGYRELDLPYQIAVHDTESEVRRSVLSLLLRGVLDSPRTLSLVKDRIVNDPSHNARADAVIALARHWPHDEDALRLLQERERSDSYDWVRSVASEILRKLPSTAK